MIPEGKETREWLCSRVDPQRYTSDRGFRKWFDDCRLGSDLLVDREGRRAIIYRDKSDLEDDEPGWRFYGMGVEAGDAVDFESALTGDSESVALAKLWNWLISDEDQPIDSIGWSTSSVVDARWNWIKDCPLPFPESIEAAQALGIRPPSKRWRRFDGSVQKTGPSTVSFGQWTGSGLTGFRLWTREGPGTATIGSDGIWTSARFVEDNLLVVADSPLEAMRMAAADKQDQTRYVAALDGITSGWLRYAGQITRAMNVPRFEVRLSNAADYEKALSYLKTSLSSNTR